jgi:hypothetical protein
MSDEELIKKTWGREDPERLFLRRLYEAAGNPDPEDLLKFLKLLHKIAVPLNQSRGLDASGELLRDKPLPTRE